MFPAVRAVNQEPRQISGADRRKGLCARGIRGTSVVDVVRHESVTSAGRRPELVRVLANRGRRRRSRAGMSEIVGFAAMMCRLSLPPTQPATGAFVNSTEATFHYGYRAIDPRVIGRLSGRRRIRVAGPETVGADTVWPTARRREGLSPAGWDISSGVSRRAMVISVPFAFEGLTTIHGKLARQYRRADCGAVLDVRRGVTAFHPARRQWVCKVTSPESDREGFTGAGAGWATREDWVASRSLGVTARGRRHQSQPAVAFSSFTERSIDGLVK